MFLDFLAVCPTRSKVVPRKRDMDLGISKKDTLAWYKKANWLTRLLALILLSNLLKPLAELKYRA